MGNNTYVLGMEGRSSPHAGSDIRKQQDTTHVWTSQTADRGVWPCGSSDKSSMPAACGFGRDCFVVPLKDAFDSLYNAVHHPTMCTECAAHLADRHNIPSTKLPPEVHRLQRENTDLTPNEPGVDV